MRIFARILVALTLLHGAASHAEEKQPKLSDLRLDLIVPTVPAFTALDVQPGVVSSPGTVRELAAALSSGLTTNGGIQTGLALEVSPFKLLNSDKFVNPDGEGTPIWLFPLQVSLASNAVTAGSDSITQLAFGARYTALQYEPAKDKKLLTCLMSRLNAPSLPQELGTAPVYSGREVLDEGLSKCRAAARAAHLATGGLEVAFATVLSSRNDARLKSLETSKMSAWASYTLAHNSFADELPALEAEDAVNRKKYSDFLKNLGTPGDTTAQALDNASGKSLTFHIRYDGLRTFADVKAQDDLLLAVRGSYLTERIGVFLEAGARGKDLTKNNGNATWEIPVGAGLDLHLSNGTWLGLFFGGDANSGNIFVLSNLKWAFGENRNF
ncbi:hypothetical protein ACN6A1_28050 [Myxococcus virescens]|uniref:hypothetical protein n=1 Tax=Myxococcus virescens TaxID=83456 RepID=UPI003DA67A65